MEVLGSNYPVPPVKVPLSSPLSLCLANIGTDAQRVSLCSRVLRLTVLFGRHASPSQL